MNCKEKGIMFRRDGVERESQGKCVVGKGRPGVGKKRII